MSDKEKAEARIDEWVKKGDASVHLDLGGMADIPELPAGLKRLWANSATTLPVLPAGLGELHANSARDKPEEPLTPETIRSFNERVAKRDAPPVVFTPVVLDGKGKGCYF